MVLRPLTRIPGTLAICLLIATLLRFFKNELLDQHTTPYFTSPSSITTCTRLWVVGDTEKKLDDGIGSYMMYLRPPVVIGTALGYTPVIQHTVSTHNNNYSVSDMINHYKDPRAVEVPNCEYRHMCTMDETCFGLGCMDLMRGFCEKSVYGTTNKDLELVKKFKDIVKDCDIVVDNSGVKIKKHYYTCGYQWTRGMVTEATKAKVRDRRPVKDAIALNVRWGDVAVEDLNDLNFRTIPPSQALAAINRIRAIAGPLKVHMFIEGHEERLRRLYNFDYEVKYSGDDLQDLVDISRHEWVIGTPATWVATAMFLANGTKWLSTESTDDKIVGYPPDRVVVLPIDGPWEGAMGIMEEEGIHSR